MPVRNEAEFIHRSLCAVLAQEYPLELMEIIVVDGLSTDHTRAIVATLAARHPRHSLRLISNPAGIVPTALNLALKQARGEVILRVDGHCQISLQHVRRCVQLLARGDWAGVGGPLTTVGETRVAQAIALAQSSRFGVGDAGFRTVHDRAMLADTIPFPAYSRAALQRAGLYDEELVRDQDDEYNYRLRGLGAHLLLDPGLRSRYYSRSSLASLWRQYYQYGFWKVRVLQKHPRQMRLRQFVPAALVVALVMTIALAVFYPWEWALALLVGGSYLLANLAAGCWTASRRGWRHLPLLPPAFATLHLSYGLGFLLGLVKFWKRWPDRQGCVPAWRETHT